MKVTCTTPYRTKDVKHLQFTQSVFQIKIDLHKTARSRKTSAEAFQVKGNQISEGE